MSDQTRDIPLVHRVPWETEQPPEQEELNEGRRLVLDLLEDHGPLDDYEIEERGAQRRRRSDLTRLGRVVPAEGLYGRSPQGKRVKKWRVR